MLIRSSNLLLKVEKKIMIKILVIEDDLEIQDLLELHLTSFPAEVIKEQDGAKGLELAIHQKPDLVLLDVTLPSMDGIEVCQKIRAAKITCPIMMLTARSEEIDRVLGLEVGADDYMTKPFSIRELLARIKAILRFRKMIEDNMTTDSKVVMEFEDLLINVEERKVLMKGERINLSPKEFELLALMTSNPGRSYSRSQLLSLIWGYDFEGYEHTINSHVNRLRAKIETDMDHPNYILTTWGVGYRFNENLK